MKLSKNVLAFSLVALCLPVLSHAMSYDIGAGAEGVHFNSSDDRLTNTTSVKLWTDAALNFIDGSDFTDVDFTALGITSWTTGRFDSDQVTVWDGADLSGLTLNFNGRFNNLRADSFVGTNFKGATLNMNGNQPFLFGDFTNAIFIGATINSDSFNMLRDANLSGADFTDAVFGMELSTAEQISLFSAGPGSTSIADAIKAVNFSGVDFSKITDEARAAMIASLGRFDGLVAIGAFYDAATLRNSIVTAEELDAAGWQKIPETGTYALFVGLAGLMFVLVRRRRS